MVVITWLISFYTEHPYMATTVTMLFVSSAVGALPSPQTNTGFYRWFFDFVHAFTGGIFRVLASRSAVDQNVQVKTVEQTTVVAEKPGTSIK